MLKRRLRQLDASSAVVTAQGGTTDQIRVELWGVTDLVAAQRVLTTRGRLELKVVEGVESSRESLLRDRGGVVPTDLDVVSGQGDATGGTVFYLVRRESVISGRDLRAARAGGALQTKSPNVQFALNPEGADVFEQATTRNIGRCLAIILDGQVMSAPTIQAPIKDHGVINGRFTDEEAGELVKVLRSGELPVKVTCLRVVGPDRR